MATIKMMSTKAAVEYLESQKAYLQRRVDNTKAGLDDYARHPARETEAFADCEKRYLRRLLYSLQNSLADTMQQLEEVNAHHHARTGE